MRKQIFLAWQKASHYDQTTGVPRAQEVFSEEKWQKCEDILKLVQHF